MGFSAMLAEARTNIPFDTGGNKSQQKILTSTSACRQGGFSIGFGSGLKDHPPTLKLRRMKQNISTAEALDVVRHDK